MRRIAVLFTVLAILSISSVTSWAQRGIAAEILSLDDGSGHIVNVKVPSGLTGGPYTYILPLTVPGGIELSLPTPTKANSTLYSNGTNAWLENTNVLATGAGAITANSLSVTSGTITSPSFGAGVGTALALTAGNGGGAGNAGGSASLTGGNSTNNIGGNAYLQGGNSGPGVIGGWAYVVGGTGGAPNGQGGFAIVDGGPGVGTQPGGNVEFQGGSGDVTSTGVGGDIVLNGGASGAGGSGGGIDFLTTPNIRASYAYRMKITNAGLVGIGPGFGPTWPFMVDQSGDVTATGSAQIGSGGQFTVDHNGHVLTSSGAGLYMAGFSGPIVSSPQPTVSGSDVAGTITFSTTATAGEGWVQIDFANDYASAPAVILTPANAAAQQGGHITGYYAQSGTYYFQIWVNCNGTATSNVQYNYLVIH
jgi:hypothetical protein